MFKFSIKRFKVYLLQTYSILLTFRHLLKLQLFKSPMGEYKSLKFELLKIKSQFFFKFKCRNYLFENKVAANDFKKRGYAVFSNTVISNTADIKTQILINGCFHAR